MRLANSGVMLTLPSLTAATSLPSYSRRRKRRPRKITTQRQENTEGRVAEGHTRDRTNLDLLTIERPDSRRAPLVSVLGGTARARSRRAHAQSDFPASYFMCVVAKSCA
jgi:hypothetical protein